MMGQRTLLFPLQPRARKASDRLEALLAFVIKDKLSGPLLLAFSFNLC